MKIQADSEPGHSSEQSPYQFGTWYPKDTMPTDGFVIAWWEDMFGERNVTCGVVYNADCVADKCPVCGAAVDEEPES